jgi:hypothetical protein
MGKTKDMGIPVENTPRIIEGPGGQTHDLVISDGWKKKKKGY